MIFSNGFVHCDPHPGNLLIRPIKQSKGEFEIVLLDHGLYQSLSEEFRYNYANIWMSILEKDIKKLEILTKHFNVNEYFTLFACIITGRSWDAISQGINKVKFTSIEVKKKRNFAFTTIEFYFFFKSLKRDEIRNGASEYLREISIVLNKIPREMLLLLKTNDLIRGLETSLHTRDSDSAFIHMTKCCVKLINNFERNQFKQKMTDSKNNQTKKIISLYKFNLISLLKEKFYLLKIIIYEFYLNLMNIK